MKPCFSIESFTEGTGRHFYRYGYGYGSSVRVLGTGTGVGRWVRDGMGVGCGCWVRVRALGIVGYGGRNWWWVLLLGVGTGVEYICLGAGTVPMYHTHAPCHRTWVRHSSTVPPYTRPYPCTVPMSRTHRTRHTYPLCDRSSK